MEQLGCESGKRRRRWTGSVEPFHCRGCGAFMDSNVPRHERGCRLPSIIRVMVAEGCSVEAMCERTGLGRTAVWARLSRMGLHVSADE